MLSVGRAFVALAGPDGSGSREVVDVCGCLAGAAVELLSAEASGLMLADSGGRVRSAATSGEGAATLELLQIGVGEGPGIDCVRSGIAVSAPDLRAATDRWPRFVAAAEEHAAFAAIHSVPLRSGGAVLGALSLLDRTPGPLPGDELTLARSLADAAAVAIRSRRAVLGLETSIEQLRTALHSRVVVEQAKGVLAQYTGLSTDDAFELLRGYVRGHNVSLTQVARLIARRELDPVLLTAYATRRRPASAGAGVAVSGLGPPPVPTGPAEPGAAAAGERRPEA